MTINWINCAARFGVGAPVDLTGVGDGSLTATEKRAVRTVLREACSMFEICRASLGVERPVAQRRNASSTGERRAGHVRRYWSGKCLSGASGSNTGMIGNRS
jgi:hypothetical protein